MNPNDKREIELGPQAYSSLLDVLIRAGLILGLAILCYQVFSPFLTLMVWALILAVTLYPAAPVHRCKDGGKQGLAATAGRDLGIVLIVVPTAVLMSSLGDSVHGLVNDVQNDTLEIPAPPESVAGWPVVGEKVHALWSRAHDDLPALVRSMQPKIGDLAKSALAFVASIGGGLLQFLASFIIAGILMAFGEAGEPWLPCHLRSTRWQGARRRVRDTVHGDHPCRGPGRHRRGLHPGDHHRPVPAVAGIPVGRRPRHDRAGARHRPGAGAHRDVPAIGYIWWSGDYGTVAAVIYTVLLFVAGMTDNVLKPLMLGRGVDAPMPVILLGALGGMATAGILGMFVGATLLALGYQIFMGWVAAAKGTTASP